MKDIDVEALLSGLASCVFVDAHLIDGVLDEPIDRGFVRVRDGRIVPRLHQLMAFQWRQERDIADFLLRIGYDALQQIAQVAIDEGVDAVGLSILSGSHKELVEDVMTQLRELGAGDVKVFVGGTIPAEDQPHLKQLGAAAIFTADMPLDDVVRILAESLA